MGLRRRTPLMRPSVLAEGAEVMKVRHLAGLRPVRRSHKLPGPLGAASLPAGGPRPHAPGRQGRKGLVRPGGNVRSTTRRDRSGPQGMERDLSVPARAPHVMTVGHVTAWEGPSVAALVLRSGPGVPSPGRALLVRAALPRGRLASPPGVGEGRDEAVALAGDGGDEARVAVVVLERDAQAADVAVDDVALGHEVHAPDGVEDLLAGHDPPAAAREQVEQALLDAREVDHRVPGPHLAVA